MSIDSLTIVSPRVNPIQYTSLTQISLSGGVFGVDIDKVEITNLNNPAGGTFNATLANVSGNEYDWQIDNVPVVSIGLNTMQVKASDTFSNYLTAIVNIYVDYAHPYTANVFPVGTGVAVNTSIRVTFSEAMENNIADFISLSPSVSGTWTANFNKTICSFTYASYLESLTEYTITVNGNAKDAISNIDVNDVYGNAGNVLNSGGTYSFTTGLGLGAHDPTRLGLTPSEPIKNVFGAIEHSIVNKDSSVIEVNHESLNSYKTTSLTLLKPYKAAGLLFVDELIKQKTSSKIANNVPIIIRPFRDKHNIGELYLQGNGASEIASINSEVANRFLSTAYTIRARENDGSIFTLDDIQKLNFIPMILSYAFDDETSGGVVHKVDNNALSLTWANPEDDDDTRLYYQIELSKTAAFAYPLAFNTEVNPEAFFTSDLGVNFEAIGLYGVRAGTGFTRFISPVELDGGIWYVRIKTGNRVIEQ